MAHGSSNLIHMFHLEPKPPRVVPNSTVRIGFLRAWSFFAFKALLIASLLNGSNLVYSFEKNIGLLDQYVRNDFPIIDYDLAIQTMPRHEDVIKVILAEKFEPRGPQATGLNSDGEVAGAHIDVDEGIKNP